jgi:hypothetical protein
VASAVLGDGPVHPIADYFAAGTVLELRAEDRQADGSYVKKVRWISEGYDGRCWSGPRRAKRGPARQSGNRQ